MQEHIRNELQNEFMSMETTVVQSCKCFLKAHSTCNIELQKYCLALYRLCKSTVAQKTRYILVGNKFRGFLQKSTVGLQLGLQNQTNVEVLYGTSTVRVLMYVHHYEASE